MRFLFSDQAILQHPTSTNAVAGTTATFRCGGLGGTLSVMVNHTYGANLHSMMERGITVEYETNEDSGTEFANVTVKTDGNNNTRIDCRIYSNKGFSPAYSHVALLRVQGTS